MSKIYEYKTETKNTNYHVVDILSITECNQDMHIGMFGFVLSSRNSSDIENTTGIVIPSSEIESLIKALSQSINKEGRAVLKLTGVQLKQIIESMKLSVEVLECEVNHADMPYDLIETLEAEFDALLQRDQAKKEA